jgi:glyoxylase-like metal-dependent hydrolase (beta-lactamase superfamily II)
LATAPAQSQGSRISRRGFLAGLILLPRLTSAQSIADSVSVITAGTNVVMLSTGDGLILVDSGAGDQLKVSGRVTTVFNTHHHLDNTGGNEALGQAGAKIIAHVNTKQWMSTPYWIPAEDRYSKPRAKAAQPTETFYTTGSLKAGGEQIDYGYLIEAHTSGDIYVYFRNANVLAVGDVASPARDPELDYFTGAWIGGRVDAMDRLLKLANDQTRIVPSFGPVMTRGQLKAERDMMSAIYDRAVDRVREADTPDEMLKAGVLEGLPRTFKDPKKFIYDLHKGLWAHHNKLNHNVV